MGARGARREAASVPQEADVQVRLNGRVVARLSASPVALRDLALGHLVLQGRIAVLSDVLRVSARGMRVDVRARSRRPRRAALPKGPRLAPAQVHALMRALSEGSAMYREGGGVHTSALASPEGLRFLAADVGKVNTLDRLAGQALLASEPTRGLVLLTTGRLTGAMVQRGLALGCPILVSHSGPTSQGLALARKAGATLVGYARGGSFKVYGGAARVQRPRP